MLSLLLALSLFCFFVLVGIATLSVLRFQESILRTWLLSPAVGLSVVVLLVLILNQAGMPVRLFAPWLLVGLFILSLLFLWFSRPILPTRQLLPFACLILFSLFYTGWPALRFGFQWISYGNGDMAYYCMGAVRFLYNGFYRIPLYAELAGIDYTQYYYYWHAYAAMRPGSDLLLALVSGVTGFSPVQINMPTIIAVGLVQIWSIGALVLYTRKWRLAALISSCFLAISPLFSFGTLYQLFAQVCGVGLLLASCSVTMRSYKFTGIADWIRHSLLMSILISALLIVYPEVMPFLALATGLYWLVELVGRRMNWNTVAFVGLGLIGIPVILRWNVISGMAMSLFQVRAGLSIRDIGNSVFPYYLVPSGLPNLFGFQPIASWSPEPLLSLTIFFSFLLLVCIIAFFLRSLSRGHPVASLFLITMALALKLFFDNNDFGLYKTAMFIQPTLMAGLALIIYRFFGRKWWIGLAVMIMMTIPTQTHYTKASMGRIGDSYCEIPLGSELGITKLKVQEGRSVLVDSYNQVAVQYAALDLRGVMTSTPSLPEIPRYRSLIYGQMPSLLYALFPHSEQVQRSSIIFDSIAQRIHIEALWNSSYAVPTYAESYYDSDYLLASSVQDVSILNKARRLHSGERYGIFQVANVSQVHNWLIFIPSSRGTARGKGGSQLVSIFQNELDYFAPRNSFAGIGSFLLFRVESPTETMRVRISLTRTLSGEGKTSLPTDAVVLGKTEQKFGIVGGGAANVFSPPIECIKQGKASYIALDMKMIAARFPRRKEGLMKLYGRDVPLDYRYVVAFCRDISAISETEYERLERPSRLRKFPDDLLKHPELEFSGIYEDGWTSEASFVKFGKSRKGDILVLRGEIPKVGTLSEFGNVLRIQINEESARMFRLNPGSFGLQVPITSNRNVTTVKMSFSERGSLPPPDGRPVAAKINDLSIKSHGGYTTR
jgi:hypothetical protein